MAEQITFLHAADLHLGAPMRGAQHLNEVWSEQLLEAILKAYDNLINIAINNKVDFVVISGDSFDTSSPSYRDFIAFFEGLKRLEKAGIPVYICTGNHDPYVSWHNHFAHLPKNVVMFDPRKASFAIYERNGKPLCLIGGRSFYNASWPAGDNIAEGITRESAITACAADEVWVRDMASNTHGSIQHRTDLLGNTPFSVGVIHTGLEFDLRKAPVKSRDLLKTNIDYWALGHIHTRHVYPSFDNPKIVFSGNIQGRDIKESGSRGCFLVTLSKGKRNKIKFEPTATIAWHEIEVDVSECETLFEVQEAIGTSFFKANANSYCEKMIGRATLIGSTSLHEYFSDTGNIEDLREALNNTYREIYCDAIVDNTRALRDLNKIVEEGLFPAVVVAKSKELQASPDEVRRLIESKCRNEGFKAPRELLFRGDSFVDSCINQGQSYVLDLLEKG